MDGDLDRATGAKNFVRKEASAIVAGWLRGTRAMENNYGKQDRQLLRNTTDALEVLTLHPWYEPFGTEWAYWIRMERCSRHPGNEGDGEERRRFLSERQMAHGQVDTGGRFAAFGRTISWYRYGSTRKLPSNVAFILKHVSAQDEALLVRSGAASVGNLTTSRRASK